MIMQEQSKSKTIKLKSNEKCSICTCGKIKNLPYCDDKHKKLNEERSTSYKSIKIIPKSDVELKLYCSKWDSESS